MNETKFEEWQFEIILTSLKTGMEIPESKCDELISMVRNWAEDNNWGIVATFNKYEFDKR